MGPLGEHPPGRVCDCCVNSIGALGEYKVTGATVEGAVNDDGARGADGARSANGAGMLAAAVAHGEDAALFEAAGGARAASGSAGGFSSKPASHPVPVSW